MSTTVPAPATAPPSPARSTGGRRMGVAAAIAAAVALCVGAALGALGGPPRVEPTFPDGAGAVTSGWGNAEVYGVRGSHILRYRHDTEVEMRLPWSGPAVADARLGSEPVHLATVTDVTRQANELALTLELSNCRYFHERAIDVHEGITLRLVNGRTSTLLFDRPLLIKSPMLASCPDRTLNRQDDKRGETYRRGG